MLRSALKIALAAFLICTVFSGIAAADDIHISGIVAFSSLDGSSDDHDGTANGVFTVDDGNLVIDGTVRCNDGPPLPGNASACPIRISVSGDLVLGAGGAIVAENRTGGGNGANITLEVGGDLSLHGPAGALPGAVISSGTTTGSGAAGSISASVDGAADLEAGSILSASAIGGSAGAVGIEAGDGIRIAGLVASGPGTSLLASRWSGAVLNGGSSGQSGGTILLRSTSADEPGILIESTGTVVSQGQSSGPQLILLEACGIEAHGLIAAVSKNDSPARVALRSGKGVLVDGRDLAGGSGSHLGRVRADSIEGGAATHLVDLFAEADIQISGPLSGTTDLFAASANPGTQAQRSGGSVSAVSLAGALAASGNAFDAGRALSGNKGGKIDLRSAGDADLADAHLRAVGGYLTTSGSRRGGQISVRSYSGEIRWTFGTGDLRPTGSGATTSSRGTITLTACAGIDTTGTAFPVLGSSVAPFPIEADGVCSPAAPTLPPGEPSLPMCNEPPVADGQAVTTDEDTAVSITLTGSDPNGDSLTFSIVTPPAHGDLGPFTSPTATSVQVVYTPDLNYNGSDSFVFQVEDGSGGTDTATVEITINAINDPPVADDDSYDVDEGGTLNQVAPGVLDGDQDPDGDSLTVTLVAGPAHATSFTLNADGSFSYTHDGSDTTSDSFTYKANDGLLDSNVATVTITINAVNDPPTADDDSYNVNEGGTLSVLAPGVLDGDQDPEGSSLSALLVAGPAHATSFTLNADGSFSYTHDGSETTSDSFTYKAYDGSLESNTATVNITINSVNDPPVAIADTASITEEAPNVAAANSVSGNVLTNDTDPDSSLTVSAVAGGSVGSPRAGSYGSVTINSDGSFTYTLDDTNPAVNALAPGNMLTDAFGYTASDGSLTSSSMLTVTIHGADDPATPDEDSFDFIGNTQLEVDRDTASTPEVLATTPPVPAALGVLDGDQDPDGGPAITIFGIVGCDDLTAPFDCVLDGQGTVSLQDDGSFSFVPEAGDIDPTASFQYTLTGNPSPATVTLTRFERVWYVDPTASDGGNGTSALPFNTLDPLSGIDGEGDSDSPADYIFVHDGTLALSASLPMENNQHLIGEGAGLSIPVNLNGNVSSTDLVPEGIRPELTNDSGDTVVVTTAIPVEVLGLSLASTTGNAIDLTSAAALTGSGTLTIGNNELRGAGADGIDVNLNVGTTGTLTLNITGNSWDLAGTHTGNAVDISRAAGTLNLDFSGNTNIVSSANNAVVVASTVLGSLNVTGFSGNSVHGNNLLAGISMSQVTFDSNPGTGGFQQVNGDSLTIGDSGNTVGGSGMSLAMVQGNLFFDDLDIYAGTSGLTLSGSGGMAFAVTPAFPAGSGTSIIRASNGAAVDVTSATLDLRLDDMDSTTSGAGVSLTTIGGTFSTDSDASISKTSGGGTAFSVASSSATVGYAGTLNVTSGSGVSLTSNSGSMSFSGGMSLSTGANAGFTATGGGTVSVTDPPGLANNTITTTSGTALTVSGTTIGASGMTFERISAGTSGSPANGIVLSNTGAGGFTVTGTGTIQNCTGDSISLTSAQDVSLTEMQISSSGDNAIDATSVTRLTLDSVDIATTGNSGINGTTVTDFKFQNGSTMTGAGNAANEHGIFITDLFGVNSAITNSSVTGSAVINVHVINNSSTAGTLTISNSTLNNTAAATGGDGVSLVGNNSANLTANLTGGNNLNNNQGDGIQISANNSSVVKVTVNGSSSNYNSNLGSAVNIAAADSATITALVSGFTGVSTGTSSANGLNAINIQNFNTSTINATVQNNVISGLGNNASAIRVIQEANGTINANINNNTINGFVANGIVAQARAGTGTLNLTIGAGNNINLASALALDALSIESGSSAGGDSNTICLNMFNNSSGAAAQQGYRLRQRTGTTFRLQNFGTSPCGSNGASATDVTCWVNTTKSNTGTTDIVIGTGFSAAPGNCPTPSLP
jgi:VCBS repeat-containing protein